jgi:hypothetical protein
LGKERAQPLILEQAAVVEQQGELRITVVGVIAAHPFRIASVMGAHREYMVAVLVGAILFRLMAVEVLSVLFTPVMHVLSHQQMQGN